MQYAALYIRVSTDDQLEFSPDAQRKALLDYAKRNDYVALPEYIFIDEGISGRKASTRPAFQRMIALAKSKPRPFDAILVHKFDRFARNREDSVVYKSLLRRECGIRVISITEQLEDDKFSVILESMLEAMGEYYSLNLSDEVKKGMTEKALRGGYQTTAPYGYEWVSGKLLPKSSEAGYVRMIFDMFIQGSSTLYIAKHLNDMGEKTKRGSPFGNRNIDYILQNPVYIGKTRWNPSGKTRLRYDDPNIIIADGCHAPLIDESTFEAAKARFVELKANAYKSARPSSEYKHWLSGLMRCGSCGGAMVFSGANLRSFQCRNYQSGKCRVSHYITSQRLENAILSYLSDYLNSTDEFDILMVPKTGSFEKDLERLQQRLDRLPQKLQRCKDAYVAQIDSLEEYAQNKKLIEQEREAIIDEIEKIKSNVPLLLGNKQLKTSVKKTLKTLQKDDVPFQQKSTAIKALIAKIVLHRPEDTLAIYFKV